MELSNVPVYIYKNDTLITTKGLLSLIRHNCSNIYKIIIYNNEDIVNNVILDKVIDSKCQYKIDRNQNKLWIYNILLGFDDNSAASYQYAIDILQKPNSCICKYYGSNTIMYCGDKTKGTFYYEGADNYIRYEGEVQVDFKNDIFPHGKGIFYSRDNKITIACNNITMGMLFSSDCKINMSEGEIIYDKEYLASLYNSNKNYTGIIKKTKICWQNDDFCQQIMDMCTSTQNILYINTNEQIKIIFHIQILLLMYQILVNINFFVVIFAWGTYYICVNKSLIRLIN